MDITSTKICTHYPIGRCKFGEDCKFLHKLPKSYYDKLRPYFQKLEDTPCMQNGQIFQLRVMSYNLLADNLVGKHHHELYRNVSRFYLDWRYRKWLIFQEIQNYQPNIICFQEVDHFQDLENGLQAMGYLGVFIKRSGDKHDGCATFWNNSVFRISNIENIKFCDYDLRDNVGQVLVLEFQKEFLDAHQSIQDQKNTASQQQNGNMGLIIANTHILFNPKRIDIKTQQAKILLQIIKEQVQQYGLPALFCGDFNTKPDSQIYNFINDGQSQSNTDKESLTGQFYYIQQSGHDDLIQSKLPDLQTHMILNQLISSNIVKDGNNEKGFPTVEQQIMLSTLYKYQYQYQQNQQHAQMSQEQKKNIQNQVQQNQEQYQQKMIQNEQQQQYRAQRRQQQLRQKEEQQNQKLLRQQEQQYQQMQQPRQSQHNQNNEQYQHNSLMTRLDVSKQWSSSRRYQAQYLKQHDKVMYMLQEKNAINNRQRQDLQPGEDFQVDFNNSGGVGYNSNIQRSSTNKASSKYNGQYQQEYRTDQQQHRMSIDQKYESSQVYDHLIADQVQDDYFALRLKSAIKKLTSVEPMYTSYHLKFKGTVDYIWYTPESVQKNDQLTNTQNEGLVQNLQTTHNNQIGDNDCDIEIISEGIPTNNIQWSVNPIGYVSAPSIEDKPISGLPSENCPSDHISIIVDFNLCFFA